MKFHACKYLDFSRDYRAQKQIINTIAGPKVFWLRNGDPSMVQFCFKRGRLNDPLACTSKEEARCRLYEEVEHEVPDEEIDN